MEASLHTIMIKHGIVDSLHIISEKEARLSMRSF